MTKTELITKILKLKNKEDDVLELKMLYQLDKDGLQSIYEAEFMKALKEGRLQSIYEAECIKALKEGRKLKDED